MIFVTKKSGTSVTVSQSVHLEYYIIYFKAIIEVM